MTISIGPPSAYTLLGLPVLDLLHPLPPLGGTALPSDRPDQKLSPPAPSLEYLLLIRKHKESTPAVKTRPGVPGLPTSLDRLPGRSSRQGRIRASRKKSKHSFLDPGASRISSPGPRWTFARPSLKSYPGPINPQAPPPTEKKLFGNEYPKNSPGHRENVQNKPYSRNREAQNSPVRPSKGFPGDYRIPDKAQNKPQTQNTPQKNPRQPHWSGKRKHATHSRAANLEKVHCVKPSFPIFLLPRRPRPALA